MLNFLAVFDGYRMSDSTLQYAVQLSTSAEAYLTGLFLDDFIYRSYNVMEVVTSGEDYERRISDLDEEDQKKRDAAVHHFEEVCRKAGVQFTIQRDKSIALQELKEESMFADLIIINENETFSRYKEKSPTRFIKDLLADVQCPVLVVPDEFKAIDKIVLLYDGGPSSLYAIKMFSYLLGNLKHLPVEVLTVNDRVENLRLPDNNRMKEFIRKDYPDAIFTVTKGDAEERILSHLRNHKENELVVLGAYRRTELSRWFKMSMADVLMREVNTPLFIAHNK